MKSLCAAGILCSLAAGAASVSQPAGEDRPIMMMAAGGSEPDIQNIMWILATDPAEDPKTGAKYDRKVLLCYRVAPGGKLMDIVDVREVTWDFKLKSLPIQGHNLDLTPDKVREVWEKERERAEKARKEAERERKNP